MSFCSNCGAGLNEGARFCSNCGASTNGGVNVAPIRPIPGGQAFVQPNSGIEELPNKAGGIDPSVRRQEYVGTVLKCPHCGNAITHTTAVCPSCGNYLTGQTAADSVKVFNQQLMAIESQRKKAGMFSSLGVSVDPADTQKLSLIRSFPIPNSVDDIIEFMVLAMANIEVSLSKATVVNRFFGSVKAGETRETMPKTISDAWVAKMQQAYQKAEIMFPNEPNFPKLTEMYLAKMKELKMKVD